MSKPPLIPSTAHEPSAALSPNDHVRMLVELLQPLGPELARRWLAALLVVERDERLAVVEMVEQRIAELYPLPNPPPNAAESPLELRVVHPPVERAGYVEQTTVTYTTAETEPDRPGAAREIEAKPARPGRARRRAQDG